MAELISTETKKEKGATWVTASVDGASLKNLQAKFDSPFQDAIGKSVGKIKDGISGKSKDFLVKLWNDRSGNADATKDPLVQQYMKRADAVNANLELQNQDMQAKMTKALFEGVDATDVFPNAPDVKKGDTIVLVNQGGKLQLTTKERMENGLSKEREKNIAATAENTLQKAAEEKALEGPSYTVRKAQEAYDENEWKRQSLIQQRNALIQTKTDTKIVWGFTSATLSQNKDVYLINNQILNTEQQIAAATQKSAQLQQALGLAKVNLASAEKVYNGTKLASNNPIK